MAEQLNGHLEKAKGALTCASSLDPTDPKYGDMLRIATVQAQVAQAAALERLADHLDYLFPRGTAVMEQQGHAGSSMPEGLRRG